MTIGITNDDKMKSKYDVRKDILLFNFGTIYLIYPRVLYSIIFEGAGSVNTIVSSVNPHG